MVLLFLFIANACAQTKEKDLIYLWPGEVPGETEAKHPAVQMDNREDNVIRLTDITNPVLEVFKPAKQNDSGLGIIVCPGGAYKHLAIDKAGYEIAEWLNKLGYTVFVLQYRVPNKQDGALNDIQRAIRIVRSQATTYNINPEKIGVMGFSAGGSLCARASTRYADTYQKIDSIDTLSSLPDFTMLIYPAYLDKGVNNTLTPELQITKETPPFFIFGTMNDHHGNSPLVMATALRNNKIPVELHMLAKGGHAYGVRPGNPAAERWPKLAEEWLKQR